MCLKGGKWIAQININHKRKFLGYFNTAKDAAIAYDKAAKDSYGKFAALNFGEL